MFLTATSVAALMPRAVSLGSELEQETCDCGRDEADLIGALLARLVQDGNIRSMEALATVIAASDWGRICASASLPRPDSKAETHAEEAKFRVGERIARRALAGVLEDHCHGATRFHREGDLPVWARGNRPVAHVGEFLFYRI